MLEQRSVHSIIQAVNLPLARQRHQNHFPGIARLKADRVPRGNIQTKAERLLAIERERTVHLEKMEMTAHLDRTIARVRNGKANFSQPNIGLKRGSADRGAN